jgi:diguanylate cyclase (GGDEF)-like protein
MREILALCAQMDRLACDTYTTMSTACADAALRDVFAKMAKDESAHVGWWEELGQAWADGLLPDIYAESNTVCDQMADTLRSLEAAVPAPGVAISGDDALTTAVSIEFFMLDPMFGELLDLAEPATAHSRHEAYDRHIDRLIKAVEDHYPAPALAGFLARVLRRSVRENRALAQYAMRDPLTDLVNRRAFGAHARQWAAWSARYGRPLAVLLVDVDHLKAINDTWGHPVGDKALVAVAAAITEATRAADVSARYGGDEFAVLAPETGPEDAHRLAERILDAVRTIDIPIDGTSVRATVSVGVTVMLDPPDSDPRRAEELLAIADQGLYAAKQAGRDRSSDTALLTAAV